jgi:Flp pilus assembly protein CpaB
LLAGGLAAAAVATGLSALAPAPQPALAVLAAARDLPAGARVGADDVRLVDLPTAVAPGGALRAASQATGRVLAGAVRAGEPLTDVRLLGAGLHPADGEVAVPVRVAEPALPLLVETGDRIDVLAAAPQGDDVARTVVADVTVLAVPQDARDGGDGSLLVVEAPPAAAARLAAAAVTSRLSVVVRPR